MEKPKFPTDKLKPQRQFALELLKQGKTNEQVQSQLKTTFGEGLSIRRLQLIRSSIVELPSKQVLIKAFQTCFLILTEPEVKKAYPNVLKTIKKYADLMINLEKQEMLSGVLPEYRGLDPILIALNTLEKSKEIWLS